jgi:hypothetical protein
MNSHQNPIELISALSDLHKGIHEILQDIYFDSLALLKRSQIEKKVASGLFDQVSQIYLGEHLKKCQPLAAGRKFTPLSPDFLNNPEFQLPPGSLLFLTNNDVGQKLSTYIEFYNRNPEVLFAIWDWDSQHWIQMSAMLAMNCDFYISGTSENTFLLSHFNPCIIGPVFVGVHQWTRQFIAENLSRLLKPRRNVPLGPHAFYGSYQRRNRALATVAKTFPSVGFVSHDYKHKSDLDNFEEWASYKTHWIAPVLGGVPIRVYNALMVGGIPILPSFYRNLPEVALLGDTPCYYEVSDLIDPGPINNQAVAKFDAAGESGLIQRAAIALEKHHIDSRCEQIFITVEKLISDIKTGNRSYLFGYLGAPHE